MLNWFRADGMLSSGIVEGFKNKLKRITRKPYYGFRTQEAHRARAFRVCHSIKIVYFHVLDQWILDMEVSGEQAENF